MVGYTWHAIRALSQGNLISSFDVWSFYRYHAQCAAPEVSLGVVCTGCLMRNWRCKVVGQNRWFCCVFCFHAICVEHLCLIQEMEKHREKIICLEASVYIHALVFYRIWTLVWMSHCLKSNCMFLNCLGKSWIMFFALIRSHIYLYLIPGAHR